MSPYGVAIASVASTLILIWLIDLLIGYPLLILLVVPIALSLILSGLRPGLVALAISIIFGDYLFIEPTREFTFHSEGLLLTTFLFTGTLLMYFIVLRRTNRPCSK